MGQTTLKQRHVLMQTKHVMEETTHNYQDRMQRNNIKAGRTQSKQKTSSDASKFIFEATQLNKISVLGYNTS